jgi:hypothetical protein
MRRRRFLLALGLLTAALAAAAAGCGSGNGEIPYPTAPTSPSSPPVPAPAEDDGFVSPGDSAEDQAANSSTRAAGGQMSERAQDRR